MSHHRHFPFQSKFCGWISPWGPYDCKTYCSNNHGGTLNKQHPLFTSPGGYMAHLGPQARSQVEGVCRPRVLPLSGLRVKCLGFHRFTLHCFPLALLWGLHDVIFWRDSVNLRAAYSEGINSLLTRDVSVFSYITNCWPQVSAGMPQCIKETS